MTVTAGLIQKLVDENATQKLDKYDYRKKYDGYASRYAALESQMDSLEKERERKGIQYDIFSGFLAGLSETGDFNEKLNIPLFLNGITAFPVFVLETIHILLASDMKVR